MKNSELQAFLQQFDGDMQIKQLDRSHKILGDIRDFNLENIIKTSETAHANPDAPEDEWDCEDGKIELGDGKQFLLINPLIL